MIFSGMNQTTKDGKKILKKPNLDKVVFGGTVLYPTTHNNKIISCLAIHTSSKPQTAYLCIECTSSSPSDLILHGIEIHDLRFNLRIHAWHCSRYAMQQLRYIF